MAAVASMYLSCDQLTSLPCHVFPSPPLISLEEALGHLEQAVAIMPLVPDTWFLMGLAYMSLERWEQAAEAFTRVVQQEPDDGRAWGNLGAIHTKVRISTHRGRDRATSYSKPQHTSDET